MILPHTQSEMKQLKIPVKVVYGGISFLFGIFFLSIWLIYSYFTMSVKTAKFDELQIDNGIQKQEILKITDKVKQLNSEMDNLNVFSRRLQILMGLDNSTEGKQIGGMADSEIDKFSVLYKKNQKVLLNQINNDIKQLKQDIPYQQNVNTLLNEIFEKNQVLLSSLPSIAPVVGGWISSGFGMRNDPFTGRRKMHYGLDIAQNKNAPVYATADGIVTHAKRAGGFGKMVAIDHGFGFTTRYAHLSVIAVKFNQKVKRGDIIGRVGSTGRSSGLHLHYEVRIEGVPVDPRSFILNKISS